jgi:transposase
MINHFFGECKEILIKVVNRLKGYEKRIYIAEIADKIGIGGQTYVAKEFNVGRDTIRKGRHELKSGIKCVDAFNARGRKNTEQSLPNLAKHICEIAELQSQTDPTFKSTRLYTRLTILEFRKQLIKEKGYLDEELPTNQTLNTLVNKLGYTMKKVQKIKPTKKIPETDAIFERLQETHDQIKDDDNIVRISIDAKDKVKIGDFSRGGKSRVIKKANDHDFGDVYVTPFGIMNVKTGEVDISIAESNITADFIVDRIEEYWDKNKIESTKPVLLINSDNGPENSSRRTQFIKRLIEFSAKCNIEIILAYYPPYHSKYNPIERVWGILESHWNGELLDTKETVFKFAKTMTYKGKNPNVTFVEKIYKKGIKLNKKTMKCYESVLERMNGVEKWFVSISPSKCKEVVNMELIS